MSILRGILLIASLALVGPVLVNAQSVGALEVKGRQIGNKGKELMRKRFYLFRGGLDANKALVDRLKAAEVTSPDCFYCKMKASPEYIAWLKAQDCESPYCRVITTEDITKVPEFQAAYKKGIEQFRNKPVVAQKWLTTNLVPSLRDGFYRQQKLSIDSLLSGIKPLQSSMIDTVSILAVFIDIQLKANDASGKATETFLISNLLPIAIGGKGYVWACEVDVGSSKKVSLPLKVTGTKKCEVIVKDLPVCAGGACSPR